MIREKPMHVARRSWIHIVCLCCTLVYGIFFRACPAPAQDVPDTRGTDFRFTFFPNYHTNNLAGLQDSLYIMIAATEPTQGTLWQRDINGIETSTAFTITDASQVLTIGIHWRNYELRGYNHDGTLAFGAADNQNGKVALQSFYVHTENDVTVYALSQAVKTSDAMMVLPVDVLGTEYYAMAYPTDGNTAVDPFGITVLTGQTTPSQLAIVATENNTQITITPSTAVLNGKTAPFAVSLQQGESYLLQADVSRTNLNADITGTRIVSDKPVAVFSGHQRSLLPVSSPTLSSRDFLIEQMPPVQTWGKQYILTPFVIPEIIDPGAQDIFRVLAAYDNTVISINNVAVATLGAGRWYEAPLTAAATLSATKEVLVAQYKRSSQSGQSDRLSDPFMIIVPPRRQFLNSYTIINSQARENKTVVYLRQYITLICPTAFTQTITIDGVPVDATRFAAVPNSCYSYASIRMTDGVHTVAAEKEFGIYIYGYGYANSYGYVGGMAFRTTPEQVAIASGDTTICAGDTARLFAAGGVSYVWQGMSLSCVDCAEPTATPNVSTLYNVTITDELGCAVTKKISVRVNQPPVTIVSSDTVICAGDSAALSVSGGTSYRWSPALGLSCTDCAQPKAAPPISTTYYTTTTNMFGCSTIDSVRVNIAPPLVVTLTQDTTICKNSSVKLEARGGVEYRWSPPDGLSCINCASPTALPEQSTTYYVLITGEYGCTTIDSVRVNVQSCTSSAGIDTFEEFPALLLCDSVSGICVVRNTGNLPLDVLSWSLQGTDMASFIVAPILPTGITLPQTLQPNDSLLFQVLFQPTREGWNEAGIVVETSAKAEPLIALCRGYGQRSRLFFTLGPDIRTYPSDTIEIHINASTGNWQEADIRSLTMEIQHKAGWMVYSGDIHRGTVLDPSWILDVAEQPGTTPEDRVTVITATGTTPITTDGTIATLSMALFLSEDLSFTPTLRATANGREQCIFAETTTSTITVETCAGSLRSVRYNDGSYFFDIIGGTIVENQTVEIHYGLGLASDVHIDLVSLTGETIRTYTTDILQPGEYQQTIDMSELAAGVYGVRFRGGIFSETSMIVLQK